MKFWFRVAFWLLIFAFLAGCAGMETKESARIKIVYDRAEKESKEVVWPGGGLEKAFRVYWSSRFAGLWKTTWEMEAPYFREMVREKKYENFIKSHGGAEDVSIDIENISLETDNLANIHCEISQINNKEKKSYFLKDKWVQVQGKWYHVISDPILFPSVN